jgi:phospholipid/cholesterol/gamma-HCH transport system substrate-binding protein
MTMSIENRARLAFAIVVLLGIAGAVGWYALSRSQYAIFQIRTHDSVSGLSVDAPVELHGVEVGKVRNVELIDPRSVSILLNVRKDIPMTMATVATITSRGVATRGFTGYVYISLEDAGTDARPLVAEAGNPYPVIHVAPSQSLNLDTAISQLNDNMQHMTELIRSVLDKETITSLKQSVDGLRQVTGMLAQNNGKLRAIISNTEQASAQFKPLLESGNDTVRALQTQVLPEAYRALSDLERLSDSLNGVATKINRDPSLILRGNAPPAPGPGETK